MTRAFILSGSRNRAPQQGSSSLPYSRSGHTCHYLRPLVNDRSATLLPGFPWIQNHPIRFLPILCSHKDLLHGGPCIGSLLPVHNHEIQCASARYCYFPWLKSVSIVLQMIFAANSMPRSEACAPSSSYISISGQLAL